MFDTVLGQEIVLKTFCGCCDQSLREGMPGKILRHFGGDPSWPQIFTEMVCHDLALAEVFPWQGFSLP